MPLNNAIPQSSQEEVKLAEYLIHQVTSKCSGELEMECFKNKPSDVYFIGNFRPVPVDDEGFDREILRKLAPSAFGAEFKIHMRNAYGTINISLSWSCYYRVFPLWKEQCQWMDERQRKIEDPKIEHVKIAREEDTLIDPTLVRSFVQRERERRSTEELFVKFKKVNCKAIGKIKLNRNDNRWNADTTDIQSSIANEITRILDLIKNDPDRIKKTAKDKRIQVTEDDIQTETHYRTFINQFTSEIEYDWNWGTSLQLIEWNDDLKRLQLLISFVNISSDDVRNENFEPFLFNPVAAFNFENALVEPFDLELAPESFRYDRELWGRGFNCGIRATEGDTYFTTHTPIYNQQRYKTKNLPEAYFKDLATNPVKVLNEILKAMESDVASWQAEEVNYRNHFIHWDSKYNVQYSEDRKTFEQEIERFRIGLELIESDPDVKLAFTLTNMTFENAGMNSNPDKAKTKWRLFQVIFLVTQLPGIAALERKYAHFKDERRIVDIIYFPTGGGKTEAYLAALIFNAFYDRIRGKKAGVTAWIRFPLRLLTVQQTQRLTDIIGNAELIRSAVEQREAKLKGSPFTVGYYVGGGSGSTPNELSSTGEWNVTNWSIAGDPVARQVWKRVISCPSCKSTKVSVEFDSAKIKILHKCNEPDCKFPGGILPIYVIDEEIYRYLPTVIVGTIDKLANIGIKSNLAMVFGKVDGVCSDHGYYNGKCTRAFDCKDEKKLTKRKIPGLTGPSLFIQDELHLLKEGLGTFDSHYETFAQYLLKEFSGEVELKIIASSATIEEYKRQSRHLYGREYARIFPGKGPTLGESFYAQTFAYPQRIFVGILPHNKTIFNAILEIVEAYHEVIHQLKSVTTTDQNTYGGSYECGSPEWTNLVDKYRSSLTYFLAGRELDSVKTDIEHYINPKFNKKGISALNVKELTGGTSTDLVTKTLKLLETEHALNEPEEAVLATSMISHGVDIDRFNAMIFYGMPRQNAEYIQASSRVGRTYVGIVFNCLHPIRERDQSHFAYFCKYHEFIGQLIEPVAINRWSSYSIDRTLPGLFMATIMQVIANRNGERDIWKYEMLQGVGKLISSGSLDINLVKEILKNGYQINSANPGDRLFDERINERVVHYFDAIKRGSQRYKKIKDVLNPSPMTSLRDIDESIFIELDSAGSEWLRNKRLKNE
jgi:hypothetical protein